MHAHTQSEELQHNNTETMHNFKKNKNFTTHVRNLHNYQPNASSNM
jgi:hypothetical protein